MKMDYTRYAQSVFIRVIRGYLSEFRSLFMCVNQCGRAPMFPAVFVQSRGMMADGLLKLFWNCVLI